MEGNFNVGNPTRENIDHAFKNLIFYINASSQLNTYKDQREEFEKVLVKINKILATYVNKESLSAIDTNILKDIKFDLIDLDTKTKPLKSYFAEWSLLWLEAIISLQMSEIKKEHINNNE